jgi:hypothetical protein
LGYYYDMCLLFYLRFSFTASTALRQIKIAAGLLKKALEFMLADSDSDDTLVDIENEDYTYLKARYLINEILLRKLLTTGTFKRRTMNELL